MNVRRLGIVALALGIALTTSGCTLWGWGYNGFGQVGNNSTINQTTPVQIGTAQWKLISAGGAHSCAVHQNTSRMWCWGSNVAGQLGDSTNTDRWQPKELPGTETYSAVATGFAHTCGIVTNQGFNGVMGCWGSNTYGQLGDGTNTTRNSGWVVDSGNPRWKSVTAGDRHTCGIRTDDTLWCWGRNNQGQLGDGTLTNRSLPVPVGTATWKSVSGGEEATCAIRSDNTLWCWGDDVASAVPVQLSADAWKQVSVGERHICGIKSNGTLWCAGQNNRGQLGDGTVIGKAMLVPIGTATWTAVEAGAVHTCGIRTGGTLWCWGDNSSGQLGDGTTTMRTSPLQIGSRTDWQGVSAGDVHTHGLIDEH